MKILIVEDEEHIAEGLSFNLEAEGFDVEVRGDGEGGLEAARSDSFAAIVLDVMLPGIDGFEVAKRLRARGDVTPMLMLTARGRPEDVLRGFEAGTDDYLAKPFDLEIFLARVRGLVRRSEWNRTAPAADAPAPVTINGKTLDAGALELRAGDETHHLTLMEMKLLGYLIGNEGRAVSRRELLERVWGLHEDTDTRAIDNFIVRLRKLIKDDPTRPRHLVTVRGIGYKFVAPDE